MTVSGFRFALTFLHSSPDPEFPLEGSGAG
ncbi:MAG: hypothetical protein ACI9UQ_002645 [Candidatus Krumholzibacteriia bacterium]